LSNEDLVRGYAAGSAPAAAGAPAQPRGTASGTVLNSVAKGVIAERLQGQDKDQQAAVQNRFVGGRAFFMKTNSWIDSEVQKKKADTKRVRLQFDSQEYFDFVKKNPNATGWLALGRNVQFVLNDTVYEIYE
jgi:hypothetical protein